jgi:light-regulated signal transduction histidine kinase (bacteriophytochrome)
VVKWFGVCTDIDDLKSLGEQLTAKTRELQLLNERLRESNVELQQLASFVAHDLQSPLNAVHSATDLLGAEFPNPMGQDAKEYFDLIHTAAGRMDTLIRSLAQYSRIASGAGNPSAPVDCNQVLSRTLMIFSNEIRASASVVTSDPLPTLQAEPDQMEQLCQNLIGNALKYRKPDQPAHIHISAALHEDEWVFSIQDDGIGIDMMKAGRIFKPFERLPGAARYGGAGLGLAICHRIVERHQGRIWFHSEPGQGATFYFALPAPLR